MRIALAQINTTVGDVAGNEAKVLEAYRRGAAEGAQLVLVPELAITGYPPRDLLLSRGFVDANLAARDRLACATGATGLVVGFVGRADRGPGRAVTNALALLQSGRVQATRTKSLLPTYDVFDEDRYFEPAESNAPVEFGGRKLGLGICEDFWNDEGFWRDRRYRRNPAAELVQAGADLLLNISASPWHLGKERTREQMLSSMAAKAARPLLYCNLVGGNDELVFDGTSLMFNASGGLVAQGKSFAEDFLVVETDSPAGISAEESCDEEQLFRALVLGLRDYLHKCGFGSAVLGLSGGIDSALTAVLAVEALGRENVLGVLLPSKFSSPGSIEDARALAQNLGIRHEVIPIEEPVESVNAQLRPVFAGRPEDVTEENLQARMRGVMLMALSNKLGALLLTTGNKSELAVGYCTLYGDMCGGLAVLSDVPKGMVYKLARWINRDRILIPEASLTKAPSAELRANQTDQDSLPPYEELDAILEDYVVRGLEVAELCAAGHAPASVRRVVGLIDRNEYKRRQAAPGLKVTSKAFGVGRRIPIAQRHREV